MGRGVEYKYGLKEGVRWTITWLHARARAMNDPHAKGILNGAAFSLGNELSEATFLEHRAAGIEQGRRAGSNANEGGTE